MAETLVAPLPVSLTEECLQDAKLYGCRSDSIKSWPKHTKVAELGVAAGWFTRQVLEVVEPTLFDAFDTFRLHEIPMLWGQESSKVLDNKTHLEYYQSKFKKQLDEGSLRTFQGDSSTELSKRESEFYDIIYIDGNHSYEGVKRDTAASLEAIKPDGMLVFNDYVFYDKTGNMFGVVPVVNDLCVNHGWKVVYLALQQEMFCDIAIVRR